MMFDIFKVLKLLLSKSLYIPESFSFNNFDLSNIFKKNTLFGFINKYSIEKCGYLGNKAASEIIKYIGARPKISLKSIL